MILKSKVCICNVVSFSEAGIPMAVHHFSHKGSVHGGMSILNHWDWIHQKMLRGCEMVLWIPVSIQTGTDTAAWMVALVTFIWIPKLAFANQCFVAVKQFLGQGILNSGSCEFRQHKWKRKRPTGLWMFSEFILCGCGCGFGVSSLLRQWSTHQLTHQNPCLQQSHIKTAPNCNPSPQSPITHYLVPYRRSFHMSRNRRPWIEPTNCLLFASREDRRPWVSQCASNTGFV